MAQNQKEQPLYLIHYRDPIDGGLISLKAKTVHDSTLGLSFVKISNFVFEEKTLIAKPSEEQLKKRLENVKSLHISIYSIISIEEIGPKHTGLSFKKDKSTLLVLPENSPRLTTQ